MESRTDFYFSVAKRKVLQQQASTPQEAWVKVQRQVDTLCRDGQLGQGVDSRYVDIQMVNTSPAKQVG